MAKGNNSAFNLNNMFEGVKPIETPSAAPLNENKSNNDNKNNISNKDNIEIKKSGMRGRPSIEAKSSRIKRTFEVQPDLWKDIQDLARLKGMPLCDLLELMMRKELDENAELMEKIKILRGD